MILTAFLAHGLGSGQGLYFGPFIAFNGGFDTFLFSILIITPSSSTESCSILSASPFCLFKPNEPSGRLKTSYPFALSKSLSTSVIFLPTISTNSFCVLARAFSPTFIVLLLYFAMPRLMRPKSTGIISMPSRAIPRARSFAETFAAVTS